VADRLILSDHGFKVQPKTVNMRHICREERNVFIHEASDER